MEHTKNSRNLQVKHTIGDNQGDSCFYHFIYDQRFNSTSFHYENMLLTFKNEVKFNTLDSSLTVDQLERYIDSNPTSTTTESWQFTYFKTIVDAVTIYTWMIQWCTVSHCCPIQADSDMNTRWVYSRNSWCTFYTRHNAGSHRLPFPHTTDFPDHQCSL